MPGDAITLRLALACFLRSPDTPLRPSVRAQLEARLAARLPDGAPVPMTDGGRRYWEAQLRAWAQGTRDPVGAVLLAALDRDGGSAIPLTPEQMTAHRRWMASTVREEKPVS